MRTAAIADTARAAGRATVGTSAIAGAGLRARGAVSAGSVTVAGRATLAIPGRVKCRGRCRSGLRRVTGDPAVCGLLANGVVRDKGAPGAIGTAVGARAGGHGPVPAGCVPCGVAETRSPRHANGPDAKFAARATHSPERGVGATIQGVTGAVLGTIAPMPRARAGTTRAASVRGASVRAAA